MMKALNTLDKSMSHLLLGLCCLLALSSLISAKPVTHFREVVEHGGRSAGAIGLKPFKITYISELESRKRDNHHTFTKRNDTGTWTIQAGDTGNGIAVRLSISFTQIMALNPTVQWQNLQIGQVLNIPCPDGGTESTIHVVMAGDTGNSIAAAYGITLDQLSSLNPNVNWYDLQMGQTLLIPQSTTPGASPTTSTESSESAQSTPSVAVSAASTGMSDGVDTSATSIIAPEPSSSETVDPASTS